MSTARAKARRALRLLLAAILACGLAPFLPGGLQDASAQEQGREASARSSGVGVAYRSQSDIESYFARNGITVSELLDTPSTFAVRPSATAPYQLGELSQTTLGQALSVLNAVRYTAGLDATVVLDDEYNELAQAGALVNAANDTGLSHYPKKPVGMESGLYQLGYDGASRSNLSSRGFSPSTAPSLCESIVGGWLEDTGASNLQAVGHRRWMLNPAMGKTGFGVAQAADGTGYLAMYAIDSSNGAASQDGVPWPAQTTPVELFGEDSPWSFSVDEDFDESDVRVTLVRERDNKTWLFSSGRSDGHFAVSNDVGSRYGRGGCVIFRPDGAGSYRDGDSYEVTIEGIPGGTIEYTVDFFCLEEGTGARDIQIWTPAHGQAKTNPVSAVPGSTVTLTVTPDPGYETSSVRVYGATTGADCRLTQAGDNAWTFAMPDEKAYVSVTFVKAQLDISVRANNCAVTVDPQNPKSGERVFVSADPDSGWQVDSVTAADAAGRRVDVSPTNDKWTFVMPDSDVTVTVRTSRIALEPHVIKVASSLHASASASLRQAMEGEQVVITACPENGHRVDAVSVRSDGAVPLDVGLRQTGPDTWAFTMPDENVTVVVTTAEDDQTAFPVTVQQPANGSLSASASSAKLGEFVTIKVATEEGWKASRVVVREEDGSYVPVKEASESSWTFAMPAAPVTVSASIVEEDAVEREVLLRNPAHAVLESVPARAAEGDAVTIVPHAEEGWRVDSVTITAASGRSVRTVKAPDGTWSFVMPDSVVTVTAEEVETETFEVRVSQPAHAAVSCNAVRAERGQEVTVVVSPEEGWVVESVAAQLSGASGLVNYMAHPNGDGTWTFYMPEENVDIVVALVQTEEDAWSCDGGAGCPTHAFWDVDHANGWCHREVDWVVEHGVMSGYANAPEPTFGPDNLLNRAQMATILHNMAGRPAADRQEAARFSDCTADEWYAEAVSWSVASGAFGGYGGTDRFGPLDDITREQMAVVLWRCSGEPAPSGNLSGFPDENDASLWARDALEWAVGEGFIRGYGDTGRLEPGAGLTRAQAATMIMRWQEGSAA